MHYSSLSVSGWRNQEQIEQKVFTCWNCCRETGNDRGYKWGDGTACIYLCPACGLPNTYHTRRGFAHRPTPGRIIKHLPEGLQGLHDEARSCLGANAFTGCVMICRKGLMNIAVENGAKEGLGFVEYVEYLKANGWTPPKSEAWLDRIRKLGNEANHQIAPKSQGDAENVLLFFEAILQFAYELPNSVQPSA